jgi:hypothetical protein
VTSPQIAQMSRRELSDDDVDELLDVLDDAMTAMTADDRQRDPHELAKHVPPNGAGSVARSGRRINRAGI